MVSIDLESPVMCSVCWEEVSGACNRSVVALQCSHLFHLDCIGSAFNASRSMRCPNCRQVENGKWWSFANDNPENGDDVAYDEDSIDEDTHPYAEMVQDPFYPHLPPTNRLSLELHMLNDQAMGEQLVRFGTGPDFNPHMVGPLLPSEVAASHVLQGHYPQGSLPHQAIFDPMQISAQAVPWYGPMVDPIGIQHQGAIFHQGALDYMIGAGAGSPFSPFIVSDYPPANYGSLYGNYTVPQHSNIPSPAVSNMAARRNAMNGMPGLSPAGNPVLLQEQTAWFNQTSSFIGSPQGDAEPYNNAASAGANCFY